MPASPAVDQEFIVHLFAPLDGPHAAAAYAHVQRVWSAGRDQLGLTGDGVNGLPGAGLPALEDIRLSARDSVLAFQQGHAGLRQAVLRRAHDVLNLSVVLSQPVPDTGRPRGRLRPVRPAEPAERRLTWADYAAWWARASPSAPAALLGEARLFLARIAPGKPGTASATPELGQELDSLLPYREERPRRWWRRGTSTTAGYALWDTELGETATTREIVLAAKADQDAELSAWAWSDGTPALPPFARYLMHAAKVRYEARLLGTWRTASTVQRDTKSVTEDLNTILELDQQGPESARRLPSLQGRLRAQAATLTQLDADMAQLEQTVSIARHNMTIQPGCGPFDGLTGLFAEDQSLTRYVAGQVAKDRESVKIQLDQVTSMLELAAADGGRAPAQFDIARRVFVVYGRDGAVQRGFFDLLYKVGLQPLEWERLVAATGSAAPFLGEVVRNAPHVAQATLVLLTPDDIVELHSDLYQGNDHDYERGSRAQPRPNVLFELGLAYAAYPERTVIVEVGRMRPIADLAGLNVIRFDGSPASVKKVIDRLVLAGCPADLSGDHWLDTGPFSGLASYRRGPGTHKPAEAEAEPGDES